jgi:hypothetical protein
MKPEDFSDAEGSGGDESSLGVILSLQESPPTITLPEACDQGLGEGNGGNGCLLVRSRRLAHQKMEASIRCRALNMMTHLGMPVSVRIA